VSRELTPANAVDIAKRGLYRPPETHRLIAALVARVEAREAELVGLTELRQIQERDAQIVVLERQRDAAVAVLRDADQKYTQESGFGYQHGAVCAALAALGAEETK
jgi:hypothetical protein